MKKLIKPLLVVFAAVSFASCTSTMPVTATSNEVGSKVGRATGSCLGAAPFGICIGADFSIKTAAKNGGITKISTVDMKVRNILNIYVTYECIVTGE